jgi:signal peptidase I
MREIIELIMIALVLFLVIHFVWHGYHMQGTNMEPNIAPNAFVMVNQESYLFSSPAHGDIIVFHYPFKTNVDVMARIIGLPGDTIKTDSSHIWVNGTLLNEPYITMPSNPSAREWKVPHDSFFVLNDNRQNFDDSRNWDALPRNFIVGKAIAIYWPLSDWHFL